MADPLEIQGRQRISFAGKTGSGKTFLSMHLLSPIRRAIVIDPKMALGKPEYRLENWNNETLDSLKDGGPGRLRVWDPPLIDKNGYPVWDPVFEIAWDLGNITVEINEMYSVAINGQMSYPLRRLYTQGRERGIGVWAETQRPSRVPLEMFSEAEWSFIFMLKMEEDRKRVAGAIGSDMIQQPIRDEHGFWVYYQTWEDPIYIRKLEIRKPKMVRVVQKVPQEVAS